MNISNTSSLSSYYSSLYSNGTTSYASSTTSSDEEETKVSVSKPQGPPPDATSQIDSNSDSSWDSEELSAYAQFSTDELGVELDADALISEYDADKDGVLGESEIQSLMDNNGLKLPPPPKSNSLAEQENMMAQMSATTSLSASTLTIADYLTEDEETVSATNLEANEFDISDYLTTEEDEEESNSEKLAEALKASLLARYEQSNYATESESSVFFA